MQILFKNQTNEILSKQTIHKRIENITQYSITI